MGKTYTRIRDGSPTVDLCNDGESIELSAWYGEGEWNEVHLTCHYRLDDEATARKDAAIIIEAVGRLSFCRADTKEVG